jgi:hypothetical protein
MRGTEKRGKEKERRKEHDGAEHRFPRRRAQTSASGQGEGEEEESTGKRINVSCPQEEGVDTECTGPVHGLDTKVLFPMPPFVHLLQACLEHGSPNSHAARA